MDDLNDIRVYPLAENLAEELARDIFDMINASANPSTPFTIALSGGNTPKLLFSVFTRQYHDKIPWERVHLFWGDERCVAPYDMESNYGMARRYLLEKVPLPEKNIHRIKGENAPYREVLRYIDEIKKHVPVKNGLPVFDLILLGLGEDGHTASLFPGQMDIMNSEKICEVARHPQTGQQRITLTGRVLNNALTVAFMVTGVTKNPIVKMLLNGGADQDKYPAANISPVSGNLIWYFDKDAAGDIQMTNIG